MCFMDRSLLGASLCRLSCERSPPPFLLPLPSSASFKKAHFIFNPQAVKVRSERQARRRAALQGGSENTGSGGGRSGGAPRTPLGESRSRNVPRPSSPKEAIDLDKMERKHEAVR